jgi:hypothetical protein
MACRIDSMDTLVLLHCSSQLTPGLPGHRSGDVHRPGHLRAVER